MMKATVIDDVCAEIGYVATCALLAWYGGRILRVPVQPENHPLIRVIGAPALRALVRAWPGETMYIPRGDLCARMARDRQATERFAEGWTPARVGADFGLTPRRAQQLRVDLVDRGWLSHSEGKVVDWRAGPKAVRVSRKLIVNF